MRIFAKRKDIRKNLPNIHTLCSGKRFNSKYSPLDIIISFSNKIPTVVSEHIWEKTCLELEFQRRNIILEVLPIFITDSSHTFWGKYEMIH